MPRIRSTKPRRERLPASIVLHGVPYKVYVRLRRRAGQRPPPDGLPRRDARNHVAGISSTRGPSRRLGMIVTAVTVRARTSLCTGTPLDDVPPRRRSGADEGQGQGAGQSFYFANARLDPRPKTRSTSTGDPPPDLWIEVDNRTSFDGRLPVYAALGVPEVWRYRPGAGGSGSAGSIGGRIYEPIDRSLAPADADPRARPGSPRDGRRFGRIGLGSPAQGLGRARNSARVPRAETEGTAFGSRSPTPSSR